MEEKKRTRRFVVTGFVLLLVSVFFKWRFIYSEPVGDRLLGLIGVPAWSDGNMGFHYTALFSLLLLIIGLIFLSKHYKGKVILVFFLVWMFIPANLFAGLYQSTFGKGVYALEFGPDESHCRYEIDDSGMMEGQCEFTFTNHGKSSVGFQVALKEDSDLGEYKYLINQNIKDETLKLNAKEQKMFEISFKEKLPSPQYQNAGGEMSGFDVTITDGEDSREMLYLLNN